MPSIITRYKHLGFYMILMIFTVTCAYFWSNASHLCLSPPIKQWCNWALQGTGWTGITNWAFLATSISGWWLQPLWKIWVSWDYYSQYMEKECSKPPTRYNLVVTMVTIMAIGMATACNRNGYCNATIIDGNGCYEYATVVYMISLEPTGIIIYCNMLTFMVTMT